MKSELLPDRERGLCGAEKVPLPPTSFAWLVEAPGLRYLAVRKALGDYRGEFYWTPKADEALRFFNETQADFTATAVRKLVPELWGFAATLGEVWPREHGWLAAADTSDGKEIPGGPETLLNTEADLKEIQS